MALSRVICDNSEYLIDVQQIKSAILNKENTILKIEYSETFLTYDKDVMQLYNYIVSELSLPTIDLTKKEIINRSFKL